MTPMDLHMTFDFAILKLEIKKSMKTKNTLKYWSIPKTHLKPPWSVQFDQIQWSWNQLWSLTKDWPI